MSQNVRVTVVAALAAAIALLAISPRARADDAWPEHTPGRPAKLVVQVVTAPGLPVAGARYRVEMHHPPPHATVEPVADLVTGPDGLTSPLAVRPGRYRVIELSPPPGSAPAGPWRATVHGRDLVIVRAEHVSLAESPSPAPAGASTTVTTAAAPTSTIATTVSTTTTTAPTSTPTTVASPDEVRGTQVERTSDEGATLADTGATTTALLALGIGFVIAGAAALGARAGRGVPPSSLLSRRPPRPPH